MASGHLATIAYGPVPSRRLGRSVGINNIPAKTCSYGCTYCQVGLTAEMTTGRRKFYSPEDILRAVETRLNEIDRQGDHIDYLSFVPDGEPTLDINLGTEIALLRKFGLPVAVITNSSLLGTAEAREDLARADWVSIKVDTVDETVWRRLNRPHPSLALAEILAGMTIFRNLFNGTLVTETMLVAGVNDTSAQATATAAFLSALGPDRAYLSVPTRPPASASVRIPTSEAIVRCYDVFTGQLGEVEYLTGYEGSDFSPAGAPRENVLGVTAVHPMREEAVRELLARTGATWALIEDLISEGSLGVVDYGGHRYYLRHPRNH